MVLKVIQFIDKRLEALPFLFFCILYTATVYNFIYFLFFLFLLQYVYIYNGNNNNIERTIDCRLCRSDDRLLRLHFTNIRYLALPQHNIQFGTNDLYTGTAQPLRCYDIHSLFSHMFYKSRISSYSLCKLKHKLNIQSKMKN